MNIQSSYILPVDPRRSAPGAATSQTKKDSQIKIWLWFIWILNVVTRARKDWSGTDGWWSALTRSNIVNSHKNATSCSQSLNSQIKQIIISQCGEYGQVNFAFDEMFYQEKCILLAKRAFKFHKWLKKPFKVQLKRCKELLSPKKSLKELLSLLKCL